MSACGARIRRAECTDSWEIIKIDMKSRIALRALRILVQCTANDVAAAVTHCRHEHECLVQNYGTLNAKWQFQSCESFAQAGRNLSSANDVNLRCHGLKFTRKDIEFGIQRFTFVLSSCWTAALHYLFGFNGLLLKTST